MIEVWGRRSSINVQKVLWALAETGSDFERHTVGGSFGGTDTREYKKLHPMSLVPAMTDGTISLFESNAIMRYVARRYGRGTIQPRGHRAFALAEQWTEWTTSTIIPAMGLVFLNVVRKPPEECNWEEVKQGERQLADAMKLANRMLGRKAHVAGKHFSYGDIPLGAAYWRYRNLEVKRPNLPNLERWFETLSARDPYREWIMVPLGRNLEEWKVNEAKLR